MGSSKSAAAADSRKMKLAALLIAVLTILLQMHTIAGRGSPQCMKGFPCPSGVCCNSKNMCGVSDTDCGPGCQSGPCTDTTPRSYKNEFGFPELSQADDSMGNEKTNSNESTTKKALVHLVTAEMFDKVFPNRDAFYSFKAFETASEAFPAFGTTGNTITKKRDVAAFFAHIGYESEGLTKLPEEPATGENDSVDFCCAGHCLELNPFAKSFSCAPGKKYFARGPLKLTWNYNYGSASKALGADLLAEPELVSKDATMFFKSALWVWMTSEDAIPSGHDVMTGPWSPSDSDIAANRLPGFGASMDVLEGTILCGHESPEAAARTENYVRIAKVFHVSAGPNLHCATMLPFN